MNDSLDPPRISGRSSPSTTFYPFFIPIVYTPLQCRSVVENMKRVETGELLHVPRLEKAAFYLQKRILELVQQNDRIPCDVHFSVHLNHYTKMLASTILDHDEDIDGEFPVSEIQYSIELCDPPYVMATTTASKDGTEPLLITTSLITKLAKYDLRHLYFCDHCQKELVERNKLCCDKCEIYKITYHEMCPICQDDDHESSPSVWAALECKHVFHKQCILQIKPCQTGRIKCPMCRWEQSHDVSFVL